MVTIKFPCVQTGSDPGRRLTNFAWTAAVEGSKAALMIETRERMLDRYRAEMLNWTSNGAIPQFGGEIGL
jgi:hypothetical protein